MEQQCAVTTTSATMDETLFEYKGGLADDLKFLAAIPEVCDVTFLVGETREPVCAVKAILAARSRYYTIAIFLHIFIKYDEEFAKL